MRRALFLSLSFAAWLSAQAPPPAPPAVFDGVDEAIAELSKITGLAPLKKVETGVIDRTGLKAYLEERIKEEVKPEEIRLEELVLKRFGLVPRDFDLKKTTVDLLTEQAAAFYDYRKKKLFVLQSETKMTGVPDELASDAQRMVVVHELAHALADQHFNLEKFIKRGRSDDASLARMAVMEGQATYLMMESVAQKMGQSLQKTPVMLEMMTMGARQSMISQYPVLSKAPLYIQATLLFPYTGGLKFQHAVIEKFGQAGFSQVFKQAPLTTQQIMHPEHYFSKTEPPKQKLPDVVDARDWSTLTDGTVGEFDHAVLLEQYLSKQDADELTPSWRGGQLALLEHKRNKHVALLYVSEWKDPASARRMFDAYRKVLGAKWKHMKIDKESDASVTGASEDGPFRLTLEGARVTSVEGARTGK